MQAIRATFSPHLNRPPTHRRPAGRLEEQKGVDILLAAIKKLPATAKVQVRSWLSSCPLPSFLRDLGPWAGRVGGMQLGIDSAMLA